MLYFKKLWDCSELYKIPVATLTLAYSTCNGFLIIDYVIPPYAADSKFPRWVASVAFGSLLVIGISYCFLVFGAFVSGPTADSSLPKDERADQRGIRQRRFSLLSFADVTCKITKADFYDEYQPKARRFGSRRTVDYVVRLKLDICMTAVTNPQDRLGKTQISCIGFSAGAK